MSLPLLVFIGLGASGKSTYAKALVKAHENEFVRVSSGDLVRELHSNLSKELRIEDEDTINKYGLSKYDGEIRSMVDASIEKATADGKAVVLDGYPRTVEQLMHILNIGKVVMVHVDIHMIMAMDRMHKRKRDKFLDVEGVVKAQTRQMSLMNGFVSDYADSPSGYAIPTLRIDNSYSEETIKYGVEEIYNFYMFNHVCFSEGAGLAVR